MKLKNKFIPLVALATTTSVVAPLVTLSSCKTTSYSFDLVNNGFNYDKGMSTIQPANIIEATTDYVDAIAKNPDLFVYDYVNYIYLSALEGIEEESIKTLNVSLTTPVINKIKVVYPGAQTMTYPTISFTINYECEEETELDTTTSNKKTKGYVTYENVPFGAYDCKIVDSSADSAWTIGVLGIAKAFPYIFDYMDENWSIKGDIQAVTTKTDSEYEGKTKTTTRSYKIDCTKTADLENLFSRAGRRKSSIGDCFLNFKSTYLSQVTINPELLGLETWTVGLHEDDDLVTLYGLQLNGSLAGATYTYTVDEPIEAPATSDSDASFKGSKLIIQKGAKLVLVGSDNYVTIQSASDTEGLVYVQPATGKTIDKQDIGYFTFPKMITIKEETSGTKNVIETNASTCVTQSPLYITPPSETTGFSAQSYTSTSQSGTDEGVLQITLTPFSFSLGADDLEISADSVIKVTTSNGQEVTFDPQDEDNVELDITSDEDFQIYLKYIGEDYTAEYPGTTYDFSSDSKLIFTSKSTGKTLKVSLAGWQAYYE